MSCVDEPQLVVCFLRNRGQILLYRNDGDTAWSIPAKTVSAANNDERLTAVAKSIATEFAPDPTLVRVGDVVKIDGLVVTPVLFDCDNRTAGRWVSPPDARDIETPNWICPAYRQVAPTVQDIRLEPEYGSSYLSVRALEILRDRAAKGASWDELKQLAGKLVDAQPGMAVLRNRINQVMFNGKESPEAVVREAMAAIPEALDAKAKAATATVGLINGMDVFTVSRSGTVLSSLKRGDPSSVIVTQSATDDEGLSAAEIISEHTPTTATIDAAAAHVLAKRPIDCVLVGADALLPTEGVVNKIGTRTAALVAAHEEIPVYVVTASDKLNVYGGYCQQHRSNREVYDGEATFDVFNPVFDVTPYTHIDRVITERGHLSIDEIEALTEEFITAADWRDSENA